MIPEEVRKVPKELKKKSPDSPSHAALLGPRKLTQRFPSSLGAALLNASASVGIAPI